MNGYCFINVIHRQEEESATHFVVNERPSHLCNNEKRRKVQQETRCIINFIYIEKSRSLRTLVAKEICRCASSLPCLRLIFIGKERKKVQKLTRGLASEQAITKKKTIKKRGEGN